MQETAFFHVEQKNQAVDEAQQLLEIGVGAAGTGIERLTQYLVGGMLDEAFAENQQGFGNALAQTFADLGAFFLPGNAPLFPDTGAFLFAAFGMERGLRGAAGVQQAQLAAVADHGPGVVGAGVEKLLRQLEGGFLACAVAATAKRGSAASSPRVCGATTTGKAPARNVTG